MVGEAPFYLGIHISNLVREGILASFQPVRDASGLGTAGALDGSLQEGRERGEWGDGDLETTIRDNAFGKGRRECMYYAVEGAADRLDDTEIWPILRGHGELGRRGRIPSSYRYDEDGDRHSVRSTRAGSGGSLEGGGKRYGAGEGGLTIRQSQAALLRRVEVNRGRRAEFVLSRWADFAPFFEPHNRDLTDGPLAQKLHLLRQVAVSAKGGERVTSQAVLPVRGQPACIKNGEMRPYQIEGLRWMVAQHDSAAGGILGDEMGLGKTLQVISFLGFLKTVRGEEGPHLVIAPLSVMNSWLMEAAKWCPALRIITFHGSAHERERLRHEVLHKGNYDLCLTTYEMLVADMHGFVSRSIWNYVIMDESHRVKNEHTQLGHAVRRLRCSHRLLITGTPLQNNMHELWSLLNILFPEALSSSSMFDAGFRIEALYTNSSDPSQVVDANLMECAHTLLRPLMLRRLKRDVLSDELPPKTEKKIVVPLSSMQRFLYSGILRNDLSTLMPNGNGRGGGGKDWSKLNSLVMQLRKVCNHPYLFPEMDPMDTDERMVNASSKLLVLDKILCKLRKEGRKALIYSQFTSMLDIIGDFLNYRGYKHLRLDGSTPAARRRYEIACFENARSPYFVYLISTRAGGLGITLVAADTVILYDSDWNPSADMQAMDRVHRIGQKRPVHCYRLCTKGTVEERILAAAQQKTLMNALVMQDDGSAHGFGTDGKSAQREVSMKDLVTAIREGLRCIASESCMTETSNWEDLPIDEILDKAETKVMVGPLGGASVHGEAANCRDSDKVAQAGALQDEEEMVEAGGEGSEEQGEKGKRQEQGEDEWEKLTDIFQTLPEIRRFEGKHYTSKRKGVQDLAAQWDLASKRQVRERVVNVDGHNVMAWTLNSKEREGGTGGPGARLESKTSKMLHRRSCQRCKRSVGEFLFCAKCPCIMHKFCVKAEGWGEFEDSSDSEAEGGEGKERNGPSEEELFNGALLEEEEEEEEEEEDSDDDFRFTGKTKAGKREGLRPRTAARRSADLERKRDFERGLEKERQEVEGHAESTQGQEGESRRQEDLGVMKRRALPRILETALPAISDARRVIAYDDDGQGDGGAWTGISGEVNSAYMGRKDATLEDGGVNSSPSLGNGTGYMTGAAGSGSARGHAEMKERLARDADWQLCAKILDALVKKRDGQHFQVPALERLPVEEHHNYTQTIKKPLDLGCIHRRFRDGYYKRIWELGDEIRQVFSNAISYHPSEHQTYKAARRLRKYLSDVALELGLELQQADTVGKFSEIIFARQSSYVTAHFCLLVCHAASSPI
jgi:superfamily II DNA or RNA helicase